MEELLQNAMNMNFVPVVDDLDNFIGIVTRRDIIRYFADCKDCNSTQQPQLLLRKQA
jgi:CBS domain-containing protein